MRRPHLWTPYQRCIAGVNAPVDAIHARHGDAQPLLQTLLHLFAAHRLPPRAALALLPPASVAGNLTLAGSVAEAVLAPIRIMPQFWGQAAPPADPASPAADLAAFLLLLLVHQTPASAPGGGFRGCFHVRPPRCPSLRAPHHSHASLCWHAHWRRCHHTISVKRQAHFPHLTRAAH